MAAVSLSSESRGIDWNAAIRFIGYTRSLHRILFVLSGFFVHYVGCTHSLCRILLRRVYSFIICTSVKYAPHSAFDSASIQSSIQPNDRIAPQKTTQTPSPSLYVTLPSIKGCRGTRLPMKKLSHFYDAWIYEGIDESIQKYLRLLKGLQRDSTHRKIWKNMKRLI